MEHALKKFRRETDVTLTAFGKRVGASKGFLSRIENRRQRPSLDLVERIVKATGGRVSADDFIDPQDVESQQ